MPGTSHPSVVDVIERVLDKGIVIDARVDVALVGIRLIAVEARVVVASITTYLRHHDALAAVTGSPAVPTVRPSDLPRSDEKSRLDAADWTSLNGSQN